jgi:hypothetical protein
MQAPDRRSRVTGPIRGLVHDDAGGQDPAGLERRAVDAVFRELDVIALPGLWSSTELSLS